MSASDRDTYSLICSGRHADKWSLRDHRQRHLNHLASLSFGLNEWWEQTNHIKCYEAAPYHHGES
eukprot:1160159-Amphidinium_carterae.2